MGVGGVEDAGEVAGVGDAVAGVDGAAGEVDANLVGSPFWLMVALTMLSVMFVLLVGMT